jgi:hypothetical protein
MTPTIEFSADNAVKAMEAYPKKTQKSTMRALNRAGDSGRSLMGSSIAKDMGLKAKDAKAAVRMVPATMDRLEVKLLASKKRLPLHDFGARQTARGVSYNMGRGRRVIPHAFVATMPPPGNHVGVFARTGQFGRRGNPKLEKIAEIPGISVGHVFDKFRDPVVAKMQATFTERLAHELKFAATEGAT